jgi:hypothetical protein
MVLQQDGKVVVGGTFGRIGGGTATFYRWGLARLTNTTPAVQQLTVHRTGRTITWQRSGALPECTHVTFDWSSDGATYAQLGVGARIAGGWELGHANVPRQVYGFVRARCQVVSSRASSSLVDSVSPVFLPNGFTDGGLLSGHIVKALHFTELRERIDALRSNHGLPAFGWTDPHLVAGMTPRAQHLHDLRTALRQAYIAAGATFPTLSDLTITSGATLIRAVHIAELRNAVTALEE